MPQARDTKRGRRKLCTKCWEDKPVSEFNRHRKTADGFRDWCRTCQGTDSRRWRQAQPAVYRASKKRWNDANIEHRRSYARTWAAGNKERVAAHTLLRKDGMSPTSAEVEELVRHLKVIWDDPCTYCGVVADEMVFDHDVPIVRGGRAVPGNINRCCWACNQAKWTQTGEEFRAHPRRAA